MTSVRCTAAGDAMIFRRLPGDYEGFSDLRAFIGRGELRLANLETTIHRYETFAAAQSGGSWFCAPPEVLEDLRAFGFNALCTANNHAMDYAHAGLIRTLEYVRAAGFACCGTGRTLAEASAAAYVDARGARHAVIGVCSTFHPDAMAGEQTRSMIGRPGLNGLRFDTLYRLPPPQMRQLEAICADAGVSAAEELSRAEGYAAPLAPGILGFGPLRFEEGESAGRRTFVREEDMRRVEAAIAEARFMADYVTVCLHAHEMAGREREQPDQFCVEFAHRCIDAGAHAVVGTGPHLLRPIEIYRGRPIFYSLGDFILQLENIARAPSEMYTGQGLRGNEGLDELFTARSQGGKRGLYYNRTMFEAVVPYWEACDGEVTRLELLAVELNFDKPRSTGGWPRPCGDGGILERLASMSKAWGTQIEIHGSLGVVKL